MATGLIALLDDIVALSKLAAASLDDVAAQAAKAGSKAAGIVIDDAAVTPRYVVGLAADRELPIIRKIAFGSLRNKLVFLLPGALALSYFAPWAIVPLLMAGGIYLSLEGFHKVLELFHHPESGQEQATGATTTTPQELEHERVASAIRTDFILSGEIMAIALGAASASPIWMQGVILCLVGIGMTVLVYGVVAIIVKADDVGFAMAQSVQAPVRALGRSIVSGMPPFLKALSFAGMLALLWVGGGIVIHGLHELGFGTLEDWLHHAASIASPGVASWLVQATLSGIFGLALGGLADVILARFRGH